MKGELNISIPELIEMLDTYNINDLSRLFYSLDSETRALITPYFISRIKLYNGIAE